MRISVLAFAALASWPSVAADAPPRHPVKVMIVNLFAFEAAPWLKVLHPEHAYEVPGLPADSPAVHCDDRGVCEMTTGMGHANAAASMMAVIYDPAFDLRQTYFLVAGIAGMDPGLGTIGSAAWARFVVDGGITHEIDAREMPSGWPDGFFGVMTNSPTEMPKLEYHSEVFRLDETLERRAFALSHAVELEDSEDVRGYRRHYRNAPADAPPTVIECDTLSSDTWWGGRLLGERASEWTRLLTKGEGRYCTSQQEDNALLTAFTRGARSGLVDMKRIAILRTGSDFDRPYPQQSVLESMQAQRDLQGAGRIAADNLVRAGMPLVAAIVDDWAQWQSHVPPVGGR